jgi:hypothetical protein
MLVECDWVMVSAAMWTGGVGFRFAVLLCGKARNVRGFVAPDFWRLFGGGWGWLTTRHGVSPIQRLNLGAVGISVLVN